MSKVTDLVVVICSGQLMGVGESTARLLAGDGAKVALGQGAKIGSTPSSGTLTPREAAHSVSRLMLTNRNVEALSEGTVDKYGLRGRDPRKKARHHAHRTCGSAQGRRAGNGMPDREHQGPLVWGGGSASDSCKGQGWATSSTSLLLRASKSSRRAAPSTARRCFGLLALASTEGLRLEHRADNIRCTIISPGAVGIDLPIESSSVVPPARKICAGSTKWLFRPDSIARAIALIEQPADVEIGGSSSGPLRRTSHAD